MSRAFNLFRLQQVDTQLDRSRSRLEEIKKLLEDDAEVKAAQAKVDAASKVAGKKRQELSTAENNTLSHNTKIEQTENHLYSGHIRNPKELQDQQNEVEALKRYLDTLEERQLEAILEMDDAQASLDAANENFNQVQAKKMGANAVLKGEQSKLETSVNDLESEKTVAIASISAEDREIYLKLREKRRGVAVAEATGQSCAACGSSLNSVLYQSARMSDQLVYCDTCKRILYVG